MIKRIENKIVYSENGVHTEIAYTVSISTKDLMDKINELVDKVNELENGKN